MVSTNHQIPRGTSTCLQADKTALQMIAGISPGGWTDVLDPTRLCPVEPQFHPDSWSSQSDRPVSQLAEKTDSEPDPTAIRLVKKSRLSHSIVIECFGRDRAKFVGTKDRQGAKFAGRFEIRERASDGQTTVLLSHNFYDKIILSLRPWRPTHPWASSHFSRYPLRFSASCFGHRFIIYQATCDTNIRE